MGWHDLPCDVRIHLLREVVAIPYYNEDDDVPWDDDDKEILGLLEESAEQEEICDWDFDDGPLWHEVIINTMLVCKEWQMIVCDLLGTGSPAVAFATVELAFDRFCEPLVLKILQKAIPRVRSDAEAGDDPADVEYIAAQRLGCWLNDSVEHGYENCVRLLLAEGADPNYYYHADDDHLVTVLGHIFGRPLVVAAEFENPGVAEILLDHGARLLPEDMVVDEDCHSSCGYILLSAAAEHTHLVPFARRLLNEGVDPEERSNEDGTPLARALAANNLEMAALLREYRADVFRPEMPGPYTVLYPEVDHAAESWSVDTVKWLLDADLNFGGSPKLKEIALTKSIYCRNVPVVPLLIERGAPVVDCHIRESIQSDFPFPIVRLLIKHADLGTIDNKDWAPHIAVETAAVHGKADILRSLIYDEGIKPKWLYINAVRLGNVECVKIMLEAGASPEPPFEYYPNALFEAMKNGCMETVQLLLDHGASVKSQLERGCDVLRVAADAGREEIARLLLAHGAKVIYKPGTSTRGTALIQKLLEEVKLSESSKEQESVSQC